MIITLNDKLEESKYYKPSLKKELIGKLENRRRECKQRPGGRKWIDYDTFIHQSLFYVEDNIEGEYAHKNYVDYLLAAWDSHWGIVVSPDIIWYTLQCELTSIVATHVDTYRSLFSTSEEKKDILVQSDSLTVMPLDGLMAELEKEVPSDITAFLPEFSTSNQRSVFARYAAFADMVSPYYNYMMFMCGFPAIDVRGDASDWTKLRDSWKRISKLFTKHEDYTARVDGILEQICGSLGDADFWRGMFSLENCGSGHQYYVRGWLTDLLEHEPDTKFPENYPSHISLVAYKQIQTQKEYEMKSGLFSSSKEGGFLVPEFAQIVYEKQPEVVTKKN